MTVTVVIRPVSLSWKDYTEQDKIIDPADKTEQSAFTAFDWDFPAVKPVRLADGNVALPDLNLTLTPIALVKKGITRSDELLSHEQFHYDVGQVISRVVKKKLEALSAKNATGLDVESDLIFQHHFVLRAGLIQRRYDKETRHGKEGMYQKSWKKLMQQTMNQPNATQIGGWWL
jgi:hypothetical protein